jgi:hypothetical protein
MPEPEIPPPEIPRFDPSAYDTLGRKDKLATLSWYLVATGVFTHQDFSLNPNWIGRMLLLVGIFSYAAGRAITYWQRFSKRRE